MVVGLGGEGRALDPAGKPQAGQHRYASFIVRMRRPHFSCRFFLAKAGLLVSFLPAARGNDSKTRSSNG